MTPRAINAAPSTASCSAHVRDMAGQGDDVVFGAGHHVAAVGDQRRAVQRLLDVQVDVHRVDVVADFEVVPDVEDAVESGHRLCGGGALSALERFLQLAGEFIGRGLHCALHDVGGLGMRLVESLFDGWLANRDEPGLVSGELLSPLVELLPGQGLS